MGRVVKLTYNARGNLTQTRDSTYHLDARPTAVTAYEYASPNTADSPSRVADSIGAQARTTTYSYTTLGLTDTVIDPRGHKTSFGYATGGLVGLVNRVTAHNVETWRDTAGVNDTAFTVQNQTTTFGFDALGNLKADTSATGVVTSYVRDLFERVAEVHDPLGTKIQRIYDAMNRVTQMVRHTTPQPNPYGINPLATPRCRIDQVLCADSTRPFVPALQATDTTKYRYGAQTLDTVVAPRGLRRSYSYEARGLLTGETDEYQHTRTAAYDEAGELVRSVSRRGDTAVTQYDAAGRSIALIYPTVHPDVLSLGDLDVPGDTIQYGYDIMGNLLTSRSRLGTTFRRYYANGLVRTEKSQLFFTDSVVYTYDVTGARTQAARTYGAKTDVFNYAYSATTGDLTSVAATYGGTSLSGRTVSFVWDGLGRRRQLTYPNNIVVKYRYDAAGVLRRVVSQNPTWRAGATNNFDFVFRADTIDAAGRALSLRSVCT
ncbi:MAG: hypothetical protein ACREMO_13470, partial [Gemmatimonadales bacterium]